MPQINEPFVNRNRPIMMGHDRNEIKPEKNAALAGLMGAEIDGHFDVFLELFMAEIKYRDPMDEEGGKSSQMLQNILMSFMAKGQAENNKQLGKMNSTFEADHSELAKQYIGKEVRYEGNMLQHDGTDDYKIICDVPKGVEEASLLVLDPKGMPVRKIAITPNEGILTLEGVHNLKWDGKNEEKERVKEGTYKVAIVAKAREEKGKSQPPVDVKTYLHGVVQAVEPFEENGAKENLFIMGDFGITKDQITRIQKKVSPFDSLWESSDPEDRLLATQLRERFIEKKYGAPSPHQSTISYIS